MLIAGVLKFDEFGRVMLSSLPAEHFNGGTPVAADGTLAGAFDEEAQVFLGAIGYREDRITNTNNPLLPPEDPLPNWDGQLADCNGMPAYWYAGLPLTADGRLSVNPGEPPEAGAYDQGFDQQAYD